MVHGAWCMVHGAQCTVHGACGRRHRTVSTHCAMQLGDGLHLPCTSPAPRLHLACTSSLHLACTSPAPPLYLACTSSLHRINKQVAQLSQLRLAAVSPKLLAARDLDLAVPGTYKPGQPTVCIRAFKSTMAVIVSKQRPRRISLVRHHKKITRRSHCNPMCPRLQPHVLEAAAPCARGCSPMCPSLQLSAQLGVL